MATLHFGITDRKVFTPVSAALGDLSNDAGTLIVLVKPGGVGIDLAGLTNSAVTTWYHMLALEGSTNKLWDDDAVAVTASATSWSSTAWWMFALDWPTGTAQTERFHYRDQTGAGAGSPGSWSHANAAGNNTGQRSGPGTGGWFTCGYNGDWGSNAKDMAVVAVWKGVRFADGDYGDMRKTSDLANHARGAPTFLCELTATSLTDLMAGSTYSSANSSGTTLTGPDPDNWTLDGLGGTPAEGPKLRTVRSALRW